MLSLHSYFKKTIKTDVLPSPNGPLKEVIPLSTIAALNKRVEKELSTTSTAESGDKRGPYSKLTPGQKAMIGKRAVVYGVTASMRYFKHKYPDMELKETSVRRFKNSYLCEVKQKSKTDISCGTWPTVPVPAFTTATANGSFLLLISLWQSRISLIVASQTLQ